MDSHNGLSDTAFSAIGPIAAPRRERGELHELRFASLFDPGRGVSVPCDAAGRVDLVSLPERLRVAYVRVREQVGRDYAFPIVQVVH